MLEKTMTFLRESVAELKRVTWPTRKEIMGSTLVVVVVVFGSKRLAGAGEDLGTAIRDFRKALRDDEVHPK